MPLWRQAWMQFTENSSAKQIWANSEEIRIVKKQRVKDEEGISFGILTLICDGLVTHGFKSCFPDCVI